MLVTCDVVHTEIRHVVKSYSQSVGGNIVGGACLKLEGQLLECCLLEAYALYHLASALVWRHAVEPLFLAVQHTDACRAVYLMTREGKEVAVHSLHVNGKVGCRLRSVHKHRHVVLVCNADNVVYGVHRA